jgi:hypothetical protein
MERVTTGVRILGVIVATSNHALLPFCMSFHLYIGQLKMKIEKNCAERE